MGQETSISVTAGTNAPVSAYQVALEKILAHYGRLRVGQLKRKGSKHRKRLAILQRAQENLQGLQAWVPQQAHTDRVKFESQLRNGVSSELSKRPRNQTWEQEIARQIGFAKSPVEMPAPKVLTPQVAPEKPVKTGQWVYVRNEDVAEVQALLQAKYEARKTA